MQAAQRSATAALQCCRRRFSTSVTKLGRRSRDPWDKRFPVSAEDVAPSKKGGSREMEQALPENIVAPTGVYHKLTGEYIHVPEMVPEFVVPDLTGFELKPYVSYRAKEIKQGPLTPKDVFDTVYAEGVEEDYKSGSIKLEGDVIRLKDGTTLNVADFIVKKEDEAQ